MPKEEVYPFCSICESSLTEADRVQNKENDLLFHPVCGECIERSIDRVFDVLQR